MEENETDDVEKDDSKGIPTKNKLQIDTGEKMLDNNDLSAILFSTITESALLFVENNSDNINKDRVGNDRMHNNNENNKEPIAKEIEMEMHIDKIDNMNNEDMIGVRNHDNNSNTNQPSVEGIEVGLNADDIDNNNHGIEDNLADISISSIALNRPIASTPRATPYSRFSKNKFKRTTINIEQSHLVDETLMLVPKNDNLNNATLSLELLSTHHRQQFNICVIMYDTVISENDLKDFPKYRYLQATFLNTTLQTIIREVPSSCFGLMYTNEISQHGNYNINVYNFESQIKPSEFFTSLAPLLHREKPMAICTLKNLRVATKNLSAFADHVKTNFPYNMLSERVRIQEYLFKNIHRPITTLNTITMNDFRTYKAIPLMHKEFLVKTRLNIKIINSNNISYTPEISRILTCIRTGAGTLNFQSSCGNGIERMLESLFPNLNHVLFIMETKNYDEFLENHHRVIVFYSNMTQHELTKQLVQRKGRYFRKPYCCFIEWETNAIHINENMLNKMRGISLQIEAHNDYLF